MSDLLISICDSSIDINELKLDEKKNLYEDNLQMFVKNLLYFYNKVSIK